MLVFFLSFFLVSSPNQFAHLKGEKKKVCSSLDEDLDLSIVEI
jgi:hypothetical protein